MTYTARDEEADARLYAEGAPGGTPARLPGHDGRARDHDRPRGPDGEFHPRRDEAVRLCRARRDRRRQGGRLRGGLAAGEGRRADFLKVKDSAGHVVDFHALRHTFITSLARGGVHPKTAQALARHSTITLTMDRYSHIGLYDEAAALETLAPTGSDRAAEALQATGTDGKPSNQTQGEASIGQRAVQRAACPAGPRVSAPVEGKAAGKAGKDAPADCGNSRKDGRLDTPRHRKSSAVRAKRTGGPSWIRTSDQGIMSPLLYR